LFSPVGNDICTPNPNARGTEPEQFYRNVLEALKVFEEKLPKGSHVVFVGLVDGRILWNNLHNLKHPLGATYSQVYDYLSCLGSNPCWLWLNKNETWRNHGSRRAQELNAQYGRVNKLDPFNIFIRSSEKEVLKTLKCLINHFQFMI
jgi:acyloxyacyl hydrolase